MASDVTSGYLTTLLGADVIDTVSLHNGSPGGAGGNEISGGGYSRQAITWGSISGGAKSNSAAVNFTTTASQAVTHIGFWDGASFMGWATNDGDATANSAGEFQLPIASVSIAITDA